MASTLESQARTEDAIRIGRPLDAEEDEARKVAFISRRLNVDRTLAARIAAYEDPKQMPLTPAQAAGGESLQGKTVDFVSVSFLDLGRAASRSVARVVYEDGAAAGTGFMVSPHLFLTNHHVISSANESAGMLLEFDYEVDPRNKKRRVTRFRLASNRLFLSDPIDDLDFALVGVGDRLDGPGELQTFGYLPLLDGEDKHITSMFVNIIQHPDGRPKEIVVRENRIMARTDNTVIYGADTLKGSSGSPVFNDEWEVVALHHWGSPYRARLDPFDGELPTSGNEGIRISAIVRHLQNEAPRLSPEERGMVREAISPQFRSPSLATLADVHRSEEGMPNREPNALSEPTLDRSGIAIWNIPLRVTVQLGHVGLATNDTIVRSPQPLAPDDSDIGPPAEGAEKLEPDTEYSNRRGYNSDFLGIPVPLPVLSPALTKLAAPNRKANAGDDPFEITYQHFSVVMNGHRRLAFFTAGNVDGSSVVRVDRKTGKVTFVESDDEDDEGAEGYEKWYDDSRIDADARSDQSLYDDEELSHFQRGHLVKRTDPSWGSPQRAIRGQADTFHFTNCAPQHEKFNPAASRWAGLENWITNNSDDEDLRVSVFTGPIFGSRDPKRGYIRVPKKYLKVVARVEDGQLLATAVVADQSDLLKPGAEGLPEVPDLVLTRQVTIEKLEELTGLDFGPLRAHDTFDAGDEDAEHLAITDTEATELGPSRLIRSFEDVSVGGTRRRSSEAKARPSTYVITVSTSAQRPRFYFHRSDEVRLDLSGGAIRKGTASRSFEDLIVPFKLRIVDVEGTAWELTIQEDGQEVCKRAGVTDRPNFVLEDRFERRPAAPFVP